MDLCKCPVCGREKRSSEYLTGFRKCIDCVTMIKEFRKSTGLKMSCLGLFYGRTETRRNT